MDLDKVLIKLEKQGWKLEKHFLEVNENFLQDLVDETEKQLILSGVSQQREMLLDFWMNLPVVHKHKAVAQHYIDNYLKSNKK
jgi:hypothetical protein